MTRIRGRHYATGEALELRFDGSLLTYLGPPVPGAAASAMSVGWVAPAFFDIQINGADGVSFNSPNLTVADVGRVVARCRRHGIGAFCPTLVTNAHAAIVHGLATIRRARDTDEAIRRAIPAIHLEGPYISPDDGARGAHPKAHVRPPDWDEFQRFQDAADALIRLVTLAPELPGGLDFVERLTAHGIVVALGHTMADRSVLRDAAAAGARLSTHLGNGCPARLPRHDNVIWDQLADDRLWASVIADGHHLPDSILRCILRVKTPARTILACDAGSLAGLPTGRYRHWEQDLEVLPEGRIVVAGTPYLAGSAAFTDTCVGHVAGIDGLRLSDAIDMASILPRDLLGLPAPAWTEGKPAEVLAFDWQPRSPLRVRALVTNGNADVFD